MTRRRAPHAKRKWLVRRRLVLACIDLHESGKTEFSSHDIDARLREMSTRKVIASGKAASGKQGGLQPNQISQKMTTVVKPENKTGISFKAPVTSGPRDIGGGINRCRRYYVSCLKSAKAYAETCAYRAEKFDKPEEWL